MMAPQTSETFIVSGQVVISIDLARSSMAGMMRTRACIVVFSILPHVCELAPASLWMVKCMSASPRLAWVIDRNIE